MFDLGMIGINTPGLFESTGSQLITFKVEVCHAQGQVRVNLMRHLGRGAPEVDHGHRPFFAFGVVSTTAQQGGAIGGVPVRAKKKTLFREKEVIFDLKEQQEHQHPKQHDASATQRTCSLIEDRCLAWQTQAYARARNAGTYHQQGVDQKQIEYRSQAQIKANKHYQRK